MWKAQSWLRMSWEKTSSQVPVSTTFAVSNSVINRKNIQEEWELLENITVEIFMSGELRKRTNAGFMKPLCAFVRTDKDEGLKCQGKPYKTKMPLTCVFHWLAYRFKDAKSMLHSTMGRGHYKLCEAYFTMLPDFHAKGKSLCREGINCQVISFAKITLIRLLNCISWFWCDS